MLHPASPVTANPWAALRQFTDARIALGRSGVSLPTAAHLAFQLAHAQARDAVHKEPDIIALAQELQLAWPAPAQPVLQLHSAAVNRSIYLQRPDLGRRLDENSRTILATALGANQREQAHQQDAYPYDLALVVADGLSALAIEQNAAPFLSHLHAHLQREAWKIAPLCLVRQARVAIGDEIAQNLGAKAVIVLIGERPGLSSPDSMGLYLTWMPRIGLTDASRNCISNVRPAGLNYEQAALKLHYLLSESRRRQLSGVDLKDETSTSTARVHNNQGNFLLK